MKIAVVRERLVRFFQEHNPERLSIIDDIIARYHDEPEQLFRDLEDRYGVPVPEVDEKDLPHESSSPLDNLNDDADENDNEDETNNNNNNEKQDSVGGDPKRAKNSNLTTANLSTQDTFGGGSGGNEITSYHSGDSHPMNRHSQDQRQQQSNNNNNNNTITMNDLGGAAEGVKYAEPDAEALAQMDDWEFEGLPLFDPRYDLPFYVKPDFGGDNNNNTSGGGTVVVDAAAAFGPHDHHHENGKSDKDKKKSNERDDAKQKVKSSEPPHFVHYANLIDNHCIYWFSLVRKFTDSLFSKVSSDQRVLFVTDRCIFLAKPTAEAEITRIIYIHEIACVFTNYEFVQKSIEEGNTPSPSTTPTKTNNNNTSSISNKTNSTDVHEENFIVFKMLPGIDQDEEDLESGCYDLYIRLPTIIETRKLLKVLTHLYRFNPIAQRKHQSELLITPINKFTPVSNSVIQLNLKRPSYLANKLLNIPQEAQPKSRRTVLKELRQFADDHGIIYSRTGKIKKAPKAYLIDADGRPSLITKRKSGVIVPIVGLKAVVKEDKKKQKTQAKTEAMEMVKMANRHVQEEMLYDPHRTVMNDPSDILAYRNQKSLDGQRASDVSRVTAEFAARSQYLQQNSPARGFLMKMLEQQQNQQQYQHHTNTMMPFSPIPQHDSLQQRGQPNPNDATSSHANLLQRVPSSVLSSSSVPLHVPGGSRSTPLNQQRDRELFLLQQQQQNQSSVGDGSKNVHVDDDDDGIIRASVPSPSRMRQFNENQLLSYVAPTISDSWKVLQESAPARVEGYVGDSVGGAASSLSKRRQHQHNIIRKVGFANAVVVEANKKHQETLATTPNNNKADQQKQKQLVSPEKAWSRASQSHNQQQENLGGGLGVSVSDDEVQQKKVNSKTSHHDANNSNNQQLGNAFVNRQGGGGSVSMTSRDRSVNSPPENSANQVLFPQSHSSHSHRSVGSRHSPDVRSQESFHMGMN